MVSSQATSKHLIRSLLESQGCELLESGSAPTTRSPAFRREGFSSHMGAPRGGSQPNTACSITAGIVHPRNAPVGPLLLPETDPRKTVMCVCGGGVAPGAGPGRLLVLTLSALQNRPSEKNEEPILSFTLDRYHLLTEGQATSGNFPSELGSSSSIQPCGLVPGTSLVTELTEEIYWGGGGGPF